MPNPFTKYTPTTYVPGYVPAPIEQYAKTIGALSAQHQQNIATKNSIDVMAANFNLIPSAQWIQDEAVAGINSDLGDILKSGRVQDASYLLPEVYKNRIGANKDLIWAERQSKKVRAAQELNLQYGAAGIDFNPADNFSPVEIDPVTKKKIYNEYNVDVEKRTNRLADLAGAFDGAQLKGSTTSLDKMKKLPFYKYIQYKGLQPSEYDKFYALAYEAFKETPSYKQMMKERKHAATSPTGVEMSDADAETDIMGFVHEAGKKYLGSSTTRYIDIPRSSSGSGFGDGNLLPFRGGQRVPIDESMSVKFPGKEKVAVKGNGEVVRRGIRAEYETIPPQMDPAAAMLSGFDNGFKRLPLTGEDKKMFNKMVAYQKKENPQYTEQKAKEEAAKIWNKGIDVSPELYYEPFNLNGDMIDYFSDKGYYYNRDVNKSSLANIGAMQFYDKTTDNNRISGNRLFTNNLGKIKYDVIRPIGRIPIDNPENNPWRMNRPIIFEAGDYSSKKDKLQNVHYFVAEENANYSTPISNLKGNFYYGYHMAGIPTEIPSTDPKAFVIPIDGKETPVNARMFSDKETLDVKFFDNKGKQVGKTIIGERRYPRDNEAGENSYVDPAEHAFIQYLKTYYPDKLGIDNSEKQ